MERREFLALIGGAVIARSLAARAQPKEFVRIGFLNTGPLESPEASDVMLDVFRQALREIGYIEGTNFSVEYRTTDGKIERFSKLVIELVRT